jgi:hypothetical protein
MRHGSTFLELTEDKDSNPQTIRKQCAQCLDRWKYRESSERAEKGLSVPLGCSKALRRELGVRS